MVLRSKEDRPKNRSDNRLIGIGCLLMLLPVCLMFIGGLLLGSPLLISLLPREMQPVFSEKMKRQFSKPFVM